VLSLLRLGTARAAEDGAARLPPLGWRSWNFFACEISHVVIEGQINALTDRSRAVDGVPTSLADLGFNSVGIDDCWQDCLAPEALNGSYHNAHGEPLVDEKRFPDLRALSDYGASRGISLGWYGNNCGETSGPGRSPKYCAEHGKLEKDWPLALRGDVAALLAANFTGIKLDNPNCGAGGGTDGDMALYYAELKRQQDARKQSEQEVVIENCHYDTSYPRWLDQPGGELACPMHLFRVSNDIKSNWPAIMANAAATAPFADGVHPISRPGCWAYPDMLEVGVVGQNGKSEGGLSLEEERTHLGLWEVLSSPLTLSFDLSNATLMDELWPLVTNPEALAVSQSWHGHPGRLVDQDVDNAGKAWQAWSKPQDKGAVAVLLIARALDMGTDLPPIDLSLRLSEYVDVTKGAPHVRDIWNRRDVDATQAVDGMLHFRNVTAHDSVFLRITPA
jgi:alpha-galactosidase